jgi:hypothetical protein
MKEVDLDEDSCRRRKTCRLERVVDVKPKVTSSTWQKKGKGAKSDEREKEGKKEKEEEEMMEKLGRGLRAPKGPPDAVRRAQRPPLGVQSA